MIDKFLVKTIMLPGGAANVANLTLADLLDDPEMKDIFESTFVVVKRLVTLAEAQSAMLTRPGCSDVFVTAGGKLDEPVQVARPTLTLLAELKVREAELVVHLTRPSLSHSRHSTSLRGVRALGLLSGGTTCLCGVLKVVYSHNRI